MGDPSETCKSNGPFAGWFLGWFGLTGAGLLWEENTVGWLVWAGWNQQANRVKVKIWSTLSKELTAGRIHPRGHWKNIWLMQLFAFQDSQNFVKWRAAVILFHTPNDAITLWLTSYNHCFQFQFQFQLAVIIYFLHSSCANQDTRCGEWLLSVHQSVTRPDPKTTFISLSLRSERLKVKETHAGRATKTFIFWCKMKIWPPLISSWN